MLLIGDSQIQKRGGSARGSMTTYTYLTEDKYTHLGKPAGVWGVNPSVIQAHLPIEGPLSIRRKAAMIIGPAFSGTSAGQDNASDDATT